MKTRVLLSAVSAAVMIGQTNPAYAIVCDGPCSGAIVAAMTSINTALAASEIALSFAVQEAYGGMAQGVSGSVSSQGKAIVEALDAVTVKLSQELRAVPAMREFYRQEMENGVNSPLMLNACTYNVRSTALAAGQQTQKASTQILVAESRAYEEQTRHYAQTTDPVTVTATNIQQLSAEVLAQEKRAGNAEIPVEEKLRFFDGSILTDEQSMILSTQAMKDSASIYRLLAVNPVPDQIIQKPASPADIQHNSEVRIRIAQRDLVHNIMAHYVGLREPTVPTTDWIRQTAGELGRGDLPENVSNEYLMYLMANYRVKSKTWTGINGLDWVNSIRDRTQIEAERQYIQAQRWETRKHINLLLAFIASAEVKEQ